jgi:class 3 adenylate cyclase
MGTTRPPSYDPVMPVCGRGGEDNPEQRAVRAALAARDSIAELNQTDPSPGLQVRVGVTTGEALVVLGGAGRRPPV